MHSFCFYFSVVLNEKQRKAKRKLIEENREKRKEEVIRQKVKDSGYDQDALTDQDRGLICEVVTAYEYTAGKATAKVSCTSLPTQIKEDNCMLDESLLAK